MNILNTYTIGGSTINVGDSFTIGEEYILYVNEIFDIDGCVYVALSTNRDVLELSVNGSNEKISINRNIMPAELFVKSNPHLFNV